MSSPDRRSTPVFVSYSRRDKKWLERLQVHLAPLVRAGDIDLWDDTRIQPGAHWKAEIERALATAQVAVLLVSADFLASDFIQDQELPVLLETAQRRGTRILPVILSHSLFTDSPLGRFQAINAMDRPLEQLTKAGRDKALSELARVIAAGLSGESAADGPASSPTPSRTAPEKAAPTRGPDGTQVQPPRGLLEKGQSARQPLATWIFGGLLLAFLFAVFAFAPPQLPEYKHRILALCAALLAGLFGWFLSGEIGLRIEALKSRFGDLAVRASGGLALFVLVLVWWLSPLAPIEPSVMAPRPQSDSILAGTVLDGDGEPLPDVRLTVPEHEIATLTDALGRFRLAVPVPAGRTVTYVAQYPGHRTHEDYAAAGTQGLKFKMEPRKP